MSYLRIYKIVRLLFKTRWKREKIDIDLSKKMKRIMVQLLLKKMKKKILLLPQKNLKKMSDIEKLQFRELIEERPLKNRECNKLN